MEYPTSKRESYTQNKDGYRDMPNLKPYPDPTFSNLKRWKVGKVVDGLMSHEDSSTFALMIISNYLEGRLTRDQMDTLYGGVRITGKTLTWLLDLIKELQLKVRSLEMRYDYPQRT